jgi:hypothetical protein
MANMASFRPARVLAALAAFALGPCVSNARLQRLASDASRAEFDRRGRVSLAVVRFENPGR